MFKIKELIVRYREIPVQVKSGLWLVLSNILVKGISFLTIPIFTHLMPAAEYGDLTVYLSSMEIVLILSGWDLAYGAYQKGLYKYQDTDFFTKTTQLFVTVSTIVLMVVLTVLYPWTGKWIAIPLELYPYLFLYLLTQPSYRNWMVQKQKKYEYKKVARISVLYTIVVTITTICAVEFLGATANIKFASQMLTSFFVFVFFYIRNINCTLLCRDRMRLHEQVRFIFLFQLPCVIHSLSLVVLSSADRIMIKNMVGSAEAAFYGVAYSFAFLMIVVQNALDQAMIPWRYELLEKKDYDALNRISCVLLIMMGAMVTVFILIAPELMKLFFSREYYEATGCIPPIAVSVYFIFLYSLFSSVEGYFEHTKWIMYVSVFCSVMNLIMNYFGIMWFGYRACAYTTLISYILFCIGHYFGMSWLCNRMIRKKIFNYRLIFFISALVFGIAMGSVLVYRIAAVRYFILLIIVAVGAVSREKIKDIAVEIRNSRR